MSENLVNIPLDTVLDGIVDTPSNNIVCNHVQLKSINKVEIEYTRSHTDYLHSSFYFILRILLIILILLIFFKYFSISDLLISTLNSVKI